MSTPSGSAAEAAPIDVLVVGSGPAGASAAVFLARQGVTVTLITRSRWVADSPRAHITNQRTMEVLRSAGLEEACRLTAAPREAMANHVLCTSIAGEEFARTWSWGNNPKRQSEYLTASPTPGCDLPQDRLEPILLGEAARLGARLRFETKFESLEQDAEGVTVTVLDQLTGKTETLRATYVIGADGGQSPVATALGLPFDGEAGMGNALNVRITADLSKHVAHRPGSLFAVLDPLRLDGMGNAMMRMVKPWNDWVVSFVNLGKREARLTEEEALIEVKNLIGDDSIEVTVTGLYPYRINHVVAQQYSVGRVFCMGDAVHRHPPMNGLGANTCIQDAWNLSWKLAYVLSGRAGAGLLDSYQAERQPVGRQIVDRAIASWKGGHRLLNVMGMRQDFTVEQRLAELEVLSAPTQEGEERRAAVREALDAKSYTYEAHGVEMNHRYASDAVVTDGLEPYAFERDPELYIQQSSYPGARLPHAWVGVKGQTVSTLDLARDDRFTLLTRPRGGVWVDAAAQLAEEFGIPLVALRVGPGGEVADLYGDFAELSEVGESGVLLVRPDQTVAWRQAVAGDDPVAELRTVLARVLDRPEVAARA